MLVVEHVVDREVVVLEILTSYLGNIFYCIYIYLNN